MTAKQRSISYRNGTPGYFNSRGVWKEVSDKQRASGSVGIIEGRAMSAEIYALRAENARLRKALGEAAQELPIVSDAMQTVLAALSAE